MTAIFKYGDNGLYGDVPVVGDCDGNGTDTIGVRRNPNVFHLRNSNSPGSANPSVGYGSGDPAAGDSLIAGDWRD